LAGEWITVEGSGLVEISKVVFPGDIEETINIEQSENGKSFRVKVPENMSDNGGHIYIEGSNGGAYSPAYFNCKNNVILDFDGRGIHAGWSDNHVKEDDLLSAQLPLGGDNVHKSQGNYAPMIPARLDSVGKGTPSATMIWTNGKADWRAQLVATGLLKPEASLEDIAIQFDIYVPEDWKSTGFIGVNLGNNFSAGNQWTGEYYNYIPWLNGATVMPFKSSGGWTTVTFPMNTFYKFSKGSFTFNDVLVFREELMAKDCGNFGLMLHNNDFTLKNITGRDADEDVKFPSAKTTVKIYVDNFRVVSLYTKKYSDYPDEDEDEE